MSTPTAVAMMASCSESAKRSLISSPIDAPVHIEVPKSSRATPQIHTANCFHIGWSRPKRARSIFRSSSDTEPLSPARRSSTMSPGTMRMSTKISTATPRRVGIIRKKRLTMYFHMRRLLGQPHRVELVVQVVAGGDRPPLDLRAVRDDPVQLERVDHVRLFVEEALLEGAKVLLPLLHIGGPRLLEEEVVDHLVLVIAAVGVRRADEARQVQVRLDDKAALEVHGHFEVAALEHRMVGRGLDHLHLDVEPDLTPLIDEPDAQRLVRVRDSAVLEREREAVRHPRLAQEALGLGTVGGDVAPEARQLLELGRRRRVRRAGYLNARHVFDQGDLGQRLGA